jgi:hypothetical protein
MIESHRGDDEHFRKATSYRRSQRAALHPIFTLLLLAMTVLVVSLAPTDNTVTAGPTQQPATTITLNPSSTSITGCELVDVDIWVNDVFNLYGADVRLSFDSSRFEVVDADSGEAGTQIKQGSLLTEPLVVTKNEANNTAGTIWFAAGQLSPTPPVSGSGILASIQFRAIAPGTAPLTFTYTKLGAPGGVEIPATSNNGTLTATGPSCVALEPPDATLNGCDTVEVEIWIRNVANLYGADVRLTFDPAVVQVVDSDLAEPGIQIEVRDLLSPPLLTTRNEADNSTGAIWFATTQLNPTPPVTGSGVLAAIEFVGVGAGTSSVHFSYTKLGDRNGIEIPATAEDGLVTATPPSAPLLDSVRLNNSTARLSWTTSTTPGVVGYSLYRATDPYFTPSGSPLYEGTGVVYDDEGVLGNPATNHYYLVRSRCDNGFESLNSNREGEFDFAISKGTAPGDLKYNFIGYTLDANGVSDAATLATYADPGTYMVFRHDAATQDVEWLIPGPPSFGTNFTVSVTNSFYLYKNQLSRTVFSLVGGVPEPSGVHFDLSPGSPGDGCKYNFITLPLHRDDLTDADSLAADIGGVYMVTRYDAPTQTVIWRIPGPPSFGSNFPIRRGYPYVVCLDSTAPTTWP